MNKLAAIGCLVLVLTGCQMNGSKTAQFVSTPDGATVTCNGCRGWGDTDDKTVMGPTPFKFEVWDRFGWFSEYIFTAKKDGFKPATVTVKEEQILHGTEFTFFPDVVKFDLQK